MRKRSEDLGRLSVMIDGIIEHDLFEKFDNYSKHFTLEEELQKRESDEARSDALWMIQAQVHHVKELLYACLEIAQGEDRLNRTEDF